MVNTPPSEAGDTSLLQPQGIPIPLSVKGSARRDLPLWISCLDGEVEEIMVDEKGIEPSTSALRTPRSPN